MLTRRILLFYSILFALDSSKGSKGIILTKNNQPVTFATVFNTRLSTWSSTNEAGLFWLPIGTIKGDSLTIKRIGMVDKSLVYSGGFQLVQMDNNPIHLSEILVKNNTGYYQMLSSGITRNQLVNSLPGAIVRSYGGSSGIAQVSIDGGRTTDAKVVFNNIDVTSPQNGVSDISQIPEQFLGYGMLKQNNNLKYGSGSSDGIIQINPWSRSSGFEIQSGQDASKALSAHINMKMGNSNIELTTGKNSNPGIYPVLYNSESISLKNQHFFQMFIGLQLHSQNGNWHKRVSFWNSIQDRGISGLIWSPNTEAFRNDTLALLSGSLVHLFPRGFVKSSFKYRRSGENYVDPIISIDSNHLSETSTTEISGLYFTKNSIEYRFHSGFSIQKVNSTDTGVYQRERYYFSPSLSLFTINEINLITAARYDNYSDFGGVITHSFKAAKNIFQWLKFSASYATSFRAPTFNDLYWVPGGNPELKPEHSKRKKISAYFYFKQLDLELFYKTSNSTDLIVWKPNDNIWRPENINKSLKNLFGINGQMNIENKFLIAGSMINIESTNQLTRQKLLYAPGWVASIQGQWSHKKWKSTLSFQFTGKQIIMHDYPTDLTMKPSINSYFSQEAPAIFNDRLQLKASISNLLNHEIMTIYGYPEPSRVFRLNIFYQINSKEQ